MKSPIQRIAIKRPCHEEWDKMSVLSDKGRYCDHCMQSVTDFTGMTEGEILERLAAGGRVCGRFTRSQLDRLNRALEPERLPSTWRAAFLALLGAASTLPPATAETLASAAQATVEPAVELQVDQTMAGEALGTDAVPIEGRVLRDFDEAPLSGATVWIMGTNHHIETDADGRFRIDPTLRTAGEPLRLRVTLEGYDTIEIVIRPGEEATPLVLHLWQKLPETITEEITVGGVTVDASSPSLMWWRLQAMFKGRS